MFASLRLSRMKPLWMRRYPSAAVTTSGQRFAPVAPWGHSSSFVEAHACRRQHQLVLANSEHRETMRIFILSLQAAAHGFPSQAILEGTGTVSPHSPSHYRLSPRLLANSIDNGWKELDPSTSDASEFCMQPKTADVAKLGYAFQKAIRRQNSETAMRLFDAAVNENAPIELRQAVDLFFLVSQKDPIASFRVLHYCNSHPNSEGPRVSMYRRLCTSIKLLNPVTSPLPDLHIFIESLMTELDTLNMDTKKQIYPNLAAALAEQRCVSIGPYARYVYDFMVENGFEIRLGWLKKLLALSKYNRQEDIPFHEVLWRIVDMGGEPHPLHTMQAIHNMFPYTDTEKVNVALGAILALMKKGKGGEKSPHAGTYSRNLMDISTLEALSAGAAHAGNAEMILRLWDIMDRGGLSPSEAFYENTVIAFANCDDGLLQAFTVLSDMKGKGFEVSRPLIRSISRAIRSYKPRVKSALQLLIDHGSVVLSLESLNVILSSFAERGDVLDALHILDIMKRYGFKPNADSYAFAVEVLGKDLARRRKGDDSVWVLRSIKTADALISKMEEQAVAPSSAVLRNYVELLCIADEVTTATAIVEDCINTERPHLIDNKTLYRVATANAKVGNTDIAKRLASGMSEVIPVLHRKIKRAEASSFDKTR